MFKDIIADYVENHTPHKLTLCQNAKFAIVRAGCVHVTT